MHTLTADNEALARAVVERALARRRDIPSPATPPGADVLNPRLRAAITAGGIGGEAALDLFATVVTPASLPIDHPDFLAFIPQAPSEAAIYADWLVSATPTFAGAWHDGTGFVAAENAALAWLAGCAGLPAGAGGCFVPGATIGTLSALHAARHTAAARVQAGGRSRPPRWAVVTSAEAHASVGLATRVMDVDLVIAPTGPDHRLHGDAVAATLDAEGGRVCAVVAAAGTTNLGVIDDLAGIAEVCARRGIWFHVDGAYGGAVVASPRARPRLAGIDRASSLVIDPHKWLFAPYDCCALLYRDPALAAPALTPRAEYIDPAHAASAWNPFSYGLHLSRRPRGVPLWFSLAVYGTDTYAAAIDDTLALARAAADEIRARPHLSLILEPALSVLAFRRVGWSAADYARWSARLLDDRRGWVAPSSLDGAPALRFCLVNPRVTLDGLRAVLDTLA